MNIVKSINERLSMKESKNNREKYQHTLEAGLLTGLVNVGKFDLLPKIVCEKKISISNT